MDLYPLLRDPGEGGWDWRSVPRSLREVEPEVVLQLAQHDGSLDGAPGWSYASVGEADPS